jgi:hypothetical protein
MTYFLATIVKDAPKRAKRASRFVMTTAGAFESHLPLQAAAGHPAPRRESPPDLKTAAKAPAMALLLLRANLYQAA